ncbi:MAG: isoleucine--tRNA ligase [Bdellovibrionota bacterium]
MSDKESLSFPEFGSDYTFSKFEESVLAYWKREKIFDTILEETKKKGKGENNFFFYDGPPFATGLPHYGHILAGTIKDIVPRYWTQRGKYVARRFGWDCHGLPIEFEIEKSLNLNGSLDILDYGVGNFNEACRSVVLRYAGEWKKVVERVGRWIDMDNDYKTMDATFMESVWWVFKTLWDKGLVYQGKKVVPYSWRLTAPLSNFEASQNYKEIQSPSIYVLFPLETTKWKEKVGVIIWTTTPWTLTANLAVAIQEDSAKLTYGRYKIEHPLVKSVVIGDFAAEKLGLTERIEEVSAKDLLGLKYEAPLKVFTTKDEPQAFQVIDGSSYVEAGEGTGLVHTAPAHGEVDFYASEKAGIGPRDATDMNGNFTEVVLNDSRLASINGKNFLESNKDILKVIKDANVLIKHETHQHSYAFCERSDTPLMNKAISSWFVKVEAIKDQMIANNQAIDWVPSHIRDGRFGKWLENARDWCISRNRFWGTPIPVWICQKCGEKEVMGSRAELEKKAGKEVPDLHMHFIDVHQWPCPKCKGEMKRTSEVLDCWFESGSMPYAQGHYPFENKEEFERNFPADFIAEGLDQTRGWFYTLTVLSTALFNKPAFKNCIVNGIVLAEDGRKMSKRLKNYPDPVELMSKYGADPMRLYLAQSPAMHAESLRFSEKNLVELMRAVMLPLWNAYTFFASYANIDSWNLSHKEVPEDTLDQWILARLKETEILYHKKMEAYELYEVAPILISFIDDLTNWYIRLNRQRFWTSETLEQDKGKRAAFTTLYTCLEKLALLMGPIMPFFAEYLDGALCGEYVLDWDKKSKKQSVHAKEFGSLPTDLTSAEEDILLEVKLAKRIMLLGRSLRGEAKIGLRQPLSQVRVAGLSPEERKVFPNVKGLILKEVNVKHVEVVDQASDLVTEEARPNFRSCGKKVGKDMKELQSFLLKWSSEDIAQFEATGSFDFKGIKLVKEDVEVLRKGLPGKLAASDRGLVVELETELSPELIHEGMQRELINRIQQRRKEMKLNLADRIQITYKAKEASLVETILNEESTSLGLVSKETLTDVWKKGAVSSPEEDFGESGSWAFDIVKSV